MCNTNLQLFRRSVFLISLILIIPYLNYAQEKPADTTSAVCAQRDLPEILRAALNKPPKVAAGEGSFLLIPIIGSNPATGFMLGVGGQYGFKMPGAGTRFSMLSGSVQFTSKHQKIFLLKNNIYTKNNNIFFTGDWRYQIFSQPTYGLGTNAPEGGILDYQFGLAGSETSIDSLAQPLNYNFIRLYQSASFRVLRQHEGFYIGLGYGLDYYSQIEDEKLRLDPDDPLITSHYAYNTYYGFSTTKYYISTLNVNLISDTRDNMINPYKGHFLMLTWRGGPKLLGNKNPSSFFHVEWRSFHPLSVKNPRHLMAFWVMGDFTPEGKFPYMTLPATAYDQRSRSARGYTQGRFRGNNLVYGEAEYRFPISQCGGIWGGVLFVNGTTATNPTQSLKLFESVKPGYGMGLRLMVDKKTRTNLAIDFGFGDKSSGFYLAATETF
ncbi:MAG TPA: BamA/TamA family outer membrane protein [Ohtaekwangia sp.]